MAVKNLESLVLQVEPVVGDEVSGCGFYGFYLAVVQTEAMHPSFFRHPMPAAPRCADYAGAARSENTGAAQAAWRAGRLACWQGVLRSRRLATFARESRLCRRSQEVGHRSQVMSKSRVPARKRLAHHLGRTSPGMVRGLVIQAQQSRQRLLRGPASA